MTLLSLLHGSDRKNAHQSCIFRRWVSRQNWVQTPRLPSTIPQRRYRLQIYVNIESNLRVRLEDKEPQCNYVWFGLYITGMDPPTLPMESCDAWIPFVCTWLQHFDTTNASNFAYISECITWYPCTCRMANTNMYVHVLLTYAIDSDWREFSDWKAAERVGTAHPRVERQRWVRCITVWARCPPGRMSGGQC